MTLRTLFRLAILSGLGALGCGGCHGHDHADDQGHGHDHAPSGEHAEEPEPIAITRWTDDYELFVELPPPQPGKPVPYHAHVTRLSDFAAVKDGVFHVRFKASDAVASEASQRGVKRPGIFVFESPAPPAGTYALEMSYELNGKTDVFDCGSVTVADKPPAQTDEGSSASITFLKESQWKIPFATAWATEHPIARSLEVPATVEPAGSDQLTIGATTGGRFFHAPKLALAEGLRVKKGDVIGTIEPTVAGEDYSRLQIAVDESRLAKAQLERELRRVEPLVAQGLLPGRRLVELRNQVETQAAKYGAAAARVSSVASSGGRNALTVRATLDGVVSQVLVPNGEPVDAGAPLVRLGGTAHLWVRSRFVAKPTADLVGAQPTAVRLASGQRFELTPHTARFLSSLPSVDPVTRIATWIVDIAPPEDESGHEVAPLDLRSGASVVLEIRFGEPKQLLAVPRAAVVEINTRPYAFVQLDGEHFEKRAVGPGQVDGPLIAITAGLTRGERVVTRGGFDIHLASLMGTVESHRH